MLKACAALLCFLLLTSTSAAEPLRPGFDSGKRLRWSKNKLSVHLSQSLTNSSPNIKHGTDTVAALAASLETWSDAAAISFQFAVSEKLSVSPAGPAGDGISLVTIAQTPENLALFEKGIADASARTRVFVDRQGHITEADIILNPFLQFSTDGTHGTYDLQSVLTHEIGHFLGLDHSGVLGSTMHDEIGRNGLFGMQNRSVRTLSGGDVSAVRGIYGGPGDQECCGRIVGRIASSKANKEMRVWAETELGAVAGEAAVRADGTFQIDGLSTGRYRIKAQDESLKINRPGAQEISAFEVTTDRISKVTITPKSTATGFDVRYLGFSGQLARAAVALNAGRSYTLLVAGTNLSSDKLQIGSSSSLIEVVGESISEIDFKESVSALSVTLRIHPATPPGEYSVYVQNDTGLRRYLVGGISVERFEDPLSLFLGSAY